MRKFWLNAIFILSVISSALAETQTVIQEGVAYIGNGITVESAQTIAIADARQKALNALGSFIESHQEVVNGRLTRQEVSSITGAVVKSKVLDESKTTEGNTFVLKLKVQFEVDTDKVVPTRLRSGN